MKVKVSYTLDLEEVPMLVDGLLSECRKKLTKELDVLKLSLYDTPKAIAQINKTRDILSMVNAQLEDVVSLISGWHETITQPKEEFDMVLKVEDTNGEE